MANISQFSTTAANNNSASPDGAPEGMAPSGVNDTIREIMAALAKWYNDTDGTLVSAGSGNAYTLTTNNAHAALADQSMIVFRANHANTGAATLDVDGLGAKSMVVKGGTALDSGAIQANQLLIASYNANLDQYELALAGAVIAAADLASSTLGFALVNGTLNASVATNILTVEIKTLAGTDPSTSDPVYALFRNSTLTNGSFVVRTITAATSIAAPDGATLGTTANEAFRYWITLHDDGGTVRLGLSNRKTTSGVSPINEAVKSTTTAINVSSDNADVYYTGAAIGTAAPLQIVGYLDYDSGLATAGTYNLAPDTIHLRTWGTKLPGDIVQTHWASKTDTQTITTQTFTDITGLSVSLNVTGAANQVLMRADLSVGGDTRTVSMRLLRGSTTLLEGDAASNRTQIHAEQLASPGDGMGSLSGMALDDPGAAGATTYKVQYRNRASADNVYINRSHGDADLAALSRGASTIMVQEIMA